MSDGTTVPAARGADGGVPAYPGADSFVKAFDRLVLQGRRHRGRVPVVLLSEPAPGAAGRRVVEGLCTRLRGQDRVLTSHAYVRAEAAAEEAEQLSVFDDLVRQLVETMPRESGRLRLPRYRLMRSVVSAPAYEGDPARRESKLRKHCYDEHRRRSPLAGSLWALGGQGDQGGSAFSMVWNFFAGPLFQRLPRAHWGVRASRLMLGKRRRPRWLAQWYRAQHGSPPRDFFHSAIGLTTGGQHSDAVMFDRVLLHALLADLEEACAKRWLNPWRRRRRSRFVLLFEESGTEDSRIQRLLRELRTASEDLGATAVLVAAAGVRGVAQRIPDIVTDGLADAGVRLGEIAQAGSESEPGERTGMVVPVAEAPEDDERARYWLGQHPVVLQHEPALGPRTELAAGVGVLALAGVVLTTVLTGVSFLPGSGDCQDEMFLGTDGTCVGVDVGASGLGNGKNEKALKEVLVQIERQNKVVEKAAHKKRTDGASPLTRYRTVVYLGAFSGGEGAEDPVRGGTLPALRGVALAQKHINDSTDPGDHVPLRVIAADAGDRLKDAEAVAQHIVELAVDEDPSIIGVVGFVQSRQSTFDAVKVLDQAGIPMVGTSGTSDRFAELGKHFFQLAPTDSRSAKIMARFVEKAAFVRGGRGAGAADEVHKADGVELVYDPDDPYSAGLGNEFNKEYEDHNPIRMHEAPASPEDRKTRLSEIARNVCEAVSENPRTALVWAGRGSEFINFLKEFNEHSTQCPRLSVLGDDDVSSALIEEAHPWSIFRGLDLHYVNDGSAPLLEKENTEAGNFRSEYASEYKTESDSQARALMYDGHSAVGWDALHYLSNGVDAAWEAVGAREDEALNRTGVQTALYQGIGGYDGATGYIDAVPGQDGRLTPNKLVFVLRSQKNVNKEPTVELKCGAVNRDGKARRWGGEDGESHSCPEQR